MVQMGTFPKSSLARQYLDLQPLGLGEAPLRCLSCELKQHRHQQYSLLSPGGTGCKWADQDAGHPLPKLLNSCSSRMMFYGVSQVGNGACRDSGEFQFDAFIHNKV